MQLDGSPITEAELATLALVGYGHFTSMRVEHRAVRGLTQHLERLSRDCNMIFGADLDIDRVRELLRRALPDADDAFVARITVFDPQITLAQPGADADPKILVTFRPAPALPAAPLTLQSASYTRDQPTIKHTGLFGSLYHRRLAQRAGFDDVLFIAPDGTLTEIATSNVGVIVEGQLIWPQADVLPGITMQLLSRTLDGESTVKPISLAEIAHADAAIATNAAVGVRAIGRIDDIELPADHATIAKLRAEYEAIPAQRI